MNKSISYFLDMDDSQIQRPEQIAHDFISLYGDQFDYAWLVHQGKGYFSRYPKNAVGPSSAIVKLIQFLFDEYVDQSFFILRNRIFSTAAMTPMCEGMVQLAAKRATGSIVPQDFQQSLQTPWTELGSETAHSLQTKHEIELDWIPPVMVEDAIDAYFCLQNLISKIPRGEVLHDFNRPIAALICAPDGQVLTWAVNNNSKNKTLHAEICAVQKYFKVHQKKIPSGARIYTSLKPCRMCAAMIFEMAEDATSIQTIFFQDDPGPLAQNTVLERKNLLKHYLLQDANT